MLQMVLAFLVKILKSHPLLGQILLSLLSKIQDPTKKNSGKFALSCRFSFLVLVDDPSPLLQNMFIGTLNKSNASVQSEPTNVLFFSLSPRKKTFVTISPKNINSPPVTPLPIF